MRAVSNFFSGNRNRNRNQGSQEPVSIARPGFQRREATAPSAKRPPATFAPKPPVYAEPTNPPEGGGTFAPKPPAMRPADDEATTSPMAGRRRRAPTVTRL
jgi:hypothetical protein